MIFSVLNTAPLYCGCPWIFSWFCGSSSELKDIPELTSEAHYIQTKKTLIILEEEFDKHFKAFFSGNLKNRKGYPAQMLKAQEKNEQEEKNKCCRACSSIKTSCEAFLEGRSQTLTEIKNTYMSFGKTLTQTNEEAKNPIVSPYSSSVIESTEEAKEKNDQCLRLLLPEGCSDYAKCIAEDTENMKKAIVLIIENHPKIQELSNNILRCKNQIEKWEKKHPQQKQATAKN